MANDLQTNLDIIDDFTQRLQVAVIGAEETTAKHEHWVEGTSSEVIQTINGPIKTLRGLIADWDALFQASFDSTIESYDSQFAEKLVEYDNDFLNYLLNIGFEPAEIYQGGITIERRSQTVAYGGVTYYWAGALPFTTTGVFANEADWLIAPIVGGIEIPQISFATGGNLVRKTQSVLGTDGEWYFWTGSFPKTIPVASTLESAGGVGLNKFKLASGHVPVRPMMKILSTAAGYALNAGSFEYGATITSSSQVLPELNTGRIWKWDGPIPKVVDLNSSPASSGGVGENLWNEVVTATGSSGSGITIGATKPTGVGSGHRWFCTTDGRTYVYFADGDSVQWVEESPQNSVFDGLEPRVRESLRRSYAEAGYNVVGTFQAGFTIVNANDVGIDLATGKGFTGPTGPVAAGTDPVSGGFVDVSGALLKDRMPSRTLSQSSYSIKPGMTATQQTAAVQGFIDSFILFGGEAFIDQSAEIDDIGIQIRSGVDVRFSSSAVFTKKPTTKGQYAMVTFSGVTNASVYKPRLIGDKYSHLADAGEWGMGIRVEGPCENVHIYDPVCDEMWGDGIYIGADGEQQYAKSVFIHRPICTKNRRQGISYIGGVARIYNPTCTLTQSADSRFTLTAGPHAGIDIEPNNSDPEIDIKIYDPVTAGNTGEGILCTMFFVSGAKEIRVEVTNHTDDNSKHGFRLLGENALLSGHIKYDGYGCKNRLSALSIDKWLKAPECDVDITMRAKLWGRSSSSTKYGAAYAWNEQSTTNGSVKIKLRCFDTPDKNPIAYHVDPQDVILDIETDNKSATAYIQAEQSSVVCRSVGPEKKRMTLVNVGAFDYFNEFEIDAANANRALGFESSWFKTMRDGDEIKVRVLNVPQLTIQTTAGQASIGGAIVRPDGTTGNFRITAGATPKTVYVTFVKSGPFMLISSFSGGVGAAI